MLLLHDKFDASCVQVLSFGKRYPNSGVDAASRSLKPSIDNHADWTHAAAPPTDSELRRRGLGMPSKNAAPAAVQPSSELLDLQPARHYLAPAPPITVADELNYHMEAIRTGRTPRRTELRPPAEVLVAVEMAKTAERIIKSTPRNSQLPKRANVHRNIDNTCARVEANFEVGAGGGSCGESDSNSSRVWRNDVTVLGPLNLPDSEDYSNSVNNAEVGMDATADEIATQLTGFFSGDLEGSGNGDVVFSPEVVATGTVPNMFYAPTAFSGVHSESGDAPPPSTSTNAYSMGSSLPIGAKWRYVDIFNNPAALGGI